MPSGASIGDLVRHGTLVLRALARRRTAVVILVAMPCAFYLASGDAVGRSVRALLFGISWAVSTVAFFATAAARQTEPRLRLAGRSGPFLATARVGALLTAAVTLAALFWLLVALDRPVRHPEWAAVGFGATAVVAVALGTAVGTVVHRELDGSLVVFTFAGLQAVINPAGTVAKALPFWSSRELGTYTVDGYGSTAAALAHAAAVVVIALAVSVAVHRWRTRHRHR